MGSLVGRAAQVLEGRHSALRAWRERPEERVARMMAGSACAARPAVLRRRQRVAVGAAEVLEALALAAWLLMTAFM